MELSRGESGPYRRVLRSARRPRSRGPAGVGDVAGERRDSAAVFDAQRRRDWQAFTYLYDPEIEWDDVSGLWGDWGTRRGFEAVRDAWVTWFEAFEQVDFDIESILEAGDEVVTSIRMSGRGRESGLLVDQRISVVWSLRGGRIARVRGYRDGTEALEAVGLSE
jgi:ketosteroid isomerase-like protein